MISGMISVIHIITDIFTFSHCYEIIFMTFCFILPFRLIIRAIFFFFLPANIFAFCHHSTTASILYTNFTRHFFDPLKSYFFSFYICINFASPDIMKELVFSYFSTLIICLYAQSIQLLFFFLRSH